MAKINLYFILFKLSLGAIFKEEDMYLVISEIMVKFSMKYGNVFSTSDNEGSINIFFF